MADDHSHTNAEWLEPPPERQGLQRYVDTLRERAGLIAACTIVTTAVAILYVLLAPKVYEATADLLITPVSADNPTLTSLGLITASADPTRDVETAAQLVTTTEVAIRAREALEETKRPRDLLGEVEAEPVAQSTIVAVTARGDSPEQASARADAFAEATVAERTERLHDQIESILPALESEVEQQPITEGVTPLESELSQLKLLGEADDPTFRIATPAETPTRQASPRPVLSTAGGLLAGLILGIVAAFAIQQLDPILRREEQLRRRYRLPILARIPMQPRRTQGGPLGLAELTPAAAEAYRSLRTTLMGEERDGRVIMITGTRASEGKTTTALNLAASFALAGSRVILIEADLRRPSLRETLNVDTDQTISDVLTERTRLKRALGRAKAYGPNLSILVADPDEEPTVDLFASRAAQTMIEQARHRADYVVIDSPPLNEVVDAMPLTDAVDDVLIVVRLGTSRLHQIVQLGELLAANWIRPNGFAVIGVRRPDPSGYHDRSGAELDQLRSDA